jgi:mycothiol synthase
VGTVHSTVYEPASVERFLAAVAAADGHPPLSEHKLTVMRDGTGRFGSWSDADGIWLVGSLARHDTDDHWAVEAAVAQRARIPAAERDAIGRATGLVPHGAHHTLWAHRSQQIAAAQALGYRAVRAVARLSGAIADVAPAGARGVEIGPMANWDVQSIVSINNRAFIGHAEQGAMTDEGFRSMERLDWFDPGGVLVARIERGVAGFCITKRAGGAVGEVYLVAVAPDAAGLGIGRALTTAGFALLGEQGAAVAHVWTDEANRSALGLYRSIGLAIDFRTWELAPAAEGRSTD